MNVDPDRERARLVIKGGKWVCQTTTAAGKWVWSKGKKVWQGAKNFFKPKKISTNIGSLDANKKIHILKPKHDWHKVTKNPDEFGSVSKIMMKVIKKGKHSKYKSVNKATMKIQGQTVVVTYKRVGDKLLISNAWVAR
ncbi:type IV secretion protein Rhs [Kurthia sibirica]|uniref:Type IV secretion protein Rhs n=2 Tax=Kurthia sibirica TaxID=202750 RepID=A0A2U3AIU0_9BACL|nr:type IV secretion protein Rhs [Kurthia sibirica]